SVLAVERKQEVPNFMADGVTLTLDAAIFVIANHARRLGIAGDEKAFERTSILADDLGDAKIAGDAGERNLALNVRVVRDDAVGQRFWRADVCKLHAQFVI